MSTETTTDSAPTTRDGQLTAENRQLEVDGETFMYRRFGNDETGAPPLLCLQHFRGNLDNWDPALVDRLAEDRVVILLDNRGVGSSTGRVPDNVRWLRRPGARARPASARPQAHPRRHCPPRRPEAPPHVGRRLRARHA